MRLYASIIFLLFLFGNTIAQNNSIQSNRIKIDNPVSVNISSLKDDWMPFLHNKEEMPLPDNYSKEDLLKLKEQVRKKYPLKNGLKTQPHINSSSSNASSPVIGRNFEGNIIGNSVPNDNDMAISNDGKLVSVINSVIYVFDINKDSLILTKSLSAFASPLHINQSKFDPKVIYDPIKDRFIMVFLNGFVYQNSKIVVGFSQTSDPAGIWNLYSLPGNPLNNNLWSDYPMISISENEFFITMNLLKNNTTWQAGFVETIIWQINKDSGYSGQALNNKLYSGIQYNSKPVRNLCPVKQGSFIEGPNMYFLSNRNLAIDNDSIFLVEITNTLDNPSTTLNVKLGICPVQYHMPPLGRQTLGKTLATNDSRILGGFLHQDQIQFVQNTLDTSTGFSAIYHGTISNLDADIRIKAHIIGDSILDFGFPNISYGGSYIHYGGVSKGENEAIITFNHTAPSVFAGFSAVYYSNEGNYSSVTTIKNGDSYINQLGGAERWGDYSGSQRKYNEPGKVWASGTFGKSNKDNGTWIAELQSPDSIKIKPAEPSKTIVFPNPSNDIFSANFSLDKDTPISIYLYDSRGRLVTQLLEEYGKTGQNIFSFSTQPLSIGLYILVVKEENNILFKEKILKGN